MTPRLLLFLVIITVSLFSACGGSPPPNTANTTTSTANKTQNNDMKNINPENKTANNVWINIHESISEWNPERDDYTSASSFMDIWLSGKNGYREEDFPQKGAAPLIKIIQNRDYFKNCGQAKDLRVHMFESAGHIKTVRNLYEELYKCPNS